MKLLIKAVGLDLSEPTKVYITEKIGRLEKLIIPGHHDSAVIDVKLVYAPHDTKATKDKCRVTISGLGEGFTLHVETEEPEMHVAIDRAARKLKEPLRRHEEKYRDHISRQARSAKEAARTADLDSGEGTP